MTTAPSNVLPLHADDYRRETFARASEFTLIAAEHQHRLMERTTIILRHRGRAWAWSVGAAFRQHVKQCPACPRCAQLLRRERLRARPMTERLQRRSKAWTVMPGRAS